MRDIHSAIVEYREAKKWSEYELAKRSGVPQSTISSWSRKANGPTIPTLMKICDALGITLSQLIEEGERITVTPEQRELLKLWAKFSSEQQESFLELFRRL